jgi:hypothetical protein
MFIQRASKCRLLIAQVAGKFLTVGVGCLTLNLVGGVGESLITGPTSVGSGDSMESNSLDETQEMLEDLTEADVQSLPVMCL